MKAKEEVQKKEFDTVQTFREIKNKISEEMQGMTFEEIKDYLKKHSLKFQAK